MNKDSKLPIRIEDLPFDPCELSKKWLIVAMFFQSASAHYKEVISLAGSASFFRQFIIEKREINIVGFDKTQKDISKFMTLQGLITGWKGIRFFAGGRLLPNTYACNETLNCYLLALSCRNHKAYCWEITEHPFLKDEFPSSRPTILTIRLTDNEDEKIEIKEKPIPLFLSPCKHLKPYALSKYHPTSLIDQIQAMAVELNVDWCPYFNPEDLKTIER
jgi:hypothetical protein